MSHDDDENLGFASADSSCRTDNGAASLDSQQDIASSSEASPQAWREHHHEHARPATGPIGKLAMRSCSSRVLSKAQLCIRHLAQMHNFTTSSSFRALCCRSSSGEHKRVPASPLRMAPVVRKC